MLLILVLRGGGPVNIGSSIPFSLSLLRLQCFLTRTLYPLLRLGRQIEGLLLNMSSAIFRHSSRLKLVKQ